MKQCPKCFTVMTEIELLTSTAYECPRCVVTKEIVVPEVSTTTTPDPYVTTTTTQSLQIPKNPIYIGTVTDYCHFQQYTLGVAGGVKYPIFLSAVYPLADGSNYHDVFQLLQDDYGAQVVIQRYLNTYGSKVRFEIFI